MIFFLLLLIGSSFSKTSFFFPDRNPFSPPRLAGAEEPTTSQHIVSHVTQGTFREFLIFGSQHSNRKKKKKALSASRIMWPVAAQLSKANKPFQLWTTPAGFVSKTDTIPDVSFNVRAALSSDATYSQLASRLSTWGLPPPLVWGLHHHRHHFLLGEHESRRLSAALLQISALEFTSEHMKGVSDAQRQSALFSSLTDWRSSAARWGGEEKKGGGKCNRITDEDRDCNRLEDNLCIHGAISHQ